MKFCSLNAKVTLVSLVMTLASSCKSRQHSKEGSRSSSINDQPEKPTQLAFPLSANTTKELDSLYEKIVLQEVGENAKNAKTLQTPKGAYKRTWDAKEGLSPLQKMLAYDIELGVVHRKGSNLQFSNSFYQWLDESLDAQGRFVFNQDGYNAWIKNFLENNKNFKGIVDSDAFKANRNTAEDFSRVEGGIQAPLIKEWIYLISAGKDGDGNRHRIKVAPMTFFKTSLKSALNFPEQLENKIIDYIGPKIKLGMLAGLSSVPPHAMLAATNSEPKNNVFLSTTNMADISVLAAGAIEFDDEGHINKFTNESGHFLPDYTALKKYVELIFRLNGVEYGKNNVQLKVFEREQGEKSGSEETPVKRFYCFYSDASKKYFAQLTASEKSEMAAASEADLVEDAKKSVGSKELLCPSNN